MKCLFLLFTYYENDHLISDSTVFTCATLSGFMEFFWTAFEYLSELLGKLNLYEGNIRIIYQIYWKQITSMQRGNELNKYVKIE